MINVQSDTVFTINGLLDCLPADARDELEQSTEMVNLDEDEEITATGEASGDFYALIHGYVSVFAPAGPDAGQVVGCKIDGQLIGLLDMLEPDGIGRVIRAHRPSILRRYPEPVFQKMLHRHPFCMQKLIETLVRHRQGLQQMREYRKDRASGMAGGGFSTTACDEQGTPLVLNLQDAATWSADMQRIRPSGLPERRLRTSLDPNRIT